MEDNRIFCSHCGAEITDDSYEELNGEVVCPSCYERHTTTCDHCGNVVWLDDSYGDEYTTLCSHCYHTHYTRCSCCDALISEADVYHLNGDDYCSDCYHEEVDRCRNIHDYGYKPEPEFYGDGNRFFGVELEVDGAGKYDDNAEQLLKIANTTQDCIYIKGDGSLDDGMELVTHPMSLKYHKQFCWEELMHPSRLS